LDRSGIQAKTAVSVEVSTKPYELVFDAIVSGPRTEHTPALEIESVSAADELGESDEIIGELDDDPLPEGDEIYDDPSRFQPRPEQKSNVVDVEIVADEYTDAIMSDHPGPTTPDDPDSSLSVDPGATPYPVAHS
jgi:hypothetical protein